MTSAELENLIMLREMQRLEFKESFGNEAIETACAFANADGGHILIGVDDAGNPSRSQLRFEALRDYENRIGTVCEPSISVEASRVGYRGRDVVVLRVWPSPVKPVSVKGRCFARRGSTNRRMSPAEIAECHLRTTGASVDALIVGGVSKDDLDFDAVREYMTVAMENGRRPFAPGDDPWDMLRRLELVRSETEITRAAYLLFARNPQEKFPQASIHAGAFDSSGAEIIDGADVKGNIQKQIDGAMNFIKRNIKCALGVEGGGTVHKRRWEFPLQALRETIANAICHRDYGSMHDIQIKIAGGVVRISSPGQLPYDMPMESFLNPLHSSRPRNKLIAQVFFDLGIIEHYGRGITKIREDCARNGNPMPIWTDANGEFVTEYAVGKGIGEMSSDTIKNGNDTIKSGDDTIKDRSDTISDAVSGLKNLPRRLVEAYRLIEARPGIGGKELGLVLSVSISTARRVTRELREMGLVEYRGSKKTGGYYCIRR